MRAIPQAGASRSDRASPATTRSIGVADRLCQLVRWSSAFSRSCEEEAKESSPLSCQRSEVTLAKPPRKIRTRSRSQSVSSLRSMTRDAARRKKIRRRHHAERVTPGNGDFGEEFQLTRSRLPRHDSERRRRAGIFAAVSLRVAQEKVSCAQSRFGLSSGKRMTSRIDSAPVRSIVRRSTPRPNPPAGGIPCSSARRKSSSSFCVSSPACSSRR